MLPQTIKKIQSKIKDKWGLWLLKKVYVPSIYNACLTIDFTLIIDNKMAHSNVITQRHIVMSQHKRSNGTFPNTILIIWKATENRNRPADKVGHLTTFLDLDTADYCRKAKR